MKEDITWENARRRGLKIVKSRWVDGRKPLPNDPNGVRSRCVALWHRRSTKVRAATTRQGSSGKANSWFDMICHSSGKIAVIPTDDIYDGEHMWFLRKPPNGTREASKMWREYDCEYVSHPFIAPNVPRLFCIAQGADRIIRWTGKVYKGFSV